MSTINYWSSICCDDDRYLHIWAWLIMDYIVKIEDDHWKCTLFSNMYFCGNLRLRELTLCYIPSPIYRIVLSMKLREN